MQLISGKQVLLGSMTALQAIKGMKYVSLIRPSGKIINFEDLLDR